MKSPLSPDSFFSNSSLASAGGRLSDFSIISSISSDIAREDFPLGNSSSSGSSFGNSSNSSPASSNESRDARYYSQFSGSQSDSNSQDNFDRASSNSSDQSIPESLDKEQKKRIEEAQRDIYEFFRNHPRHDTKIKKGKVQDLIKFYENNLSKDSKNQSRSSLGEGHNAEYYFGFEGYQSSSNQSVGSDISGSTNSSINSYEPAPDQFANRNQSLGSIGSFGNFSSQPSSSNISFVSSSSDISSQDSSDRYNPTNPRNDSFGQVSLGSMGSFGNFSSSASLPNSINGQQSGDQSNLRNKEGFHNLHDTFSAPEVPQNNKKSYETPRAEFLDNSSGNVKELINKFEQKIDGQKFNFSNQQNNNIDTGKHYEQITPSTKLGQPINGGKSVGGDLHR